MPNCFFLSGPRAAEYLSMPDAIAAVREAFIALSDGTALAPTRTAAPLPGGGPTLAMTASLPSLGVTAVKVVSVVPDNPARGLPTVVALLTVYDAATGMPLAVLEAGALTGIRTGAASGVATDLLARPDAAVLGLIGAGFQARYQAEAVASVRPLERVRVYSRDPRRRAAFAAELQALFRAWGYGAEVRAAGSAAEAVRGADVICAATSSSTPVFDAADIAPGAHVNGVGSYTLAMREIPTDLARRARVVVDSRDAAEAEAGDLLPLVGEGALAWAALPEIGELLAGRQPGRRCEEEITFFKSVGVGVQDGAVGGVVAQRLSERGGGTELRLGEARVGG